jgi:hypothetical protein
MTKIDEFNRINGPRVQRARDQLGHIQKSAASMRIDDAAVWKLLEPLRDRIAAMEWGDTEIAESEAELRPRMPQAEDVAAPVACEIETLASLSTQQLVDRMIACGAELAVRRK